MAGEDALRRVRLTYVGTVQGVGFRWTSQRVARELGLTGWARNEYDGSVTIELQGTSAQISQFQTSLIGQYQRWGRARNMILNDVDELQVLAGEDDFSVRFA